MHILHLLHHSIPLDSAYSRRTKAILEQQAKLGWRTTQLTGCGQGLMRSAQEEVDSMRFHRTAPLTFPLKSLPGINRLVEMRQLAKQAGKIVSVTPPDIIHAHFPAQVGLPALILKKRCRIPLVYEMQAYFGSSELDRSIGYAKLKTSPLRRAMERYVMRHADALIATSEAFARAMLDMGVAESKIWVVPDGINMDRFQSRGSPVIERLKRGLGLENKLILAFIGPLMRYEGVSMLLQAMPRILLKYPDTCLLLVGDGPELDRLVHEVKRLEIQSSVKFIGTVTTAQIND